MRRPSLSLAALLGLVLLGSGTAASSADEIRVAVASNFSRAIEAIVESFERQTGHEVIVALASTGKHYAQIRNGAPFDVFLAADEERPRLLEEAGLAVPGTRFIYALGTLVLWSPQAGMVDPAGLVLGTGDFRFLAMANPRLAPYGRAAREVLESRGLWQRLQGRIVRGENIAQAYHFVASGNVELGFVALSQVEGSGEALQGSWWEIPTELYSPIAQQAVMLEESAAAREFLDFVRQAGAMGILGTYGYATP